MAAAESSLLLLSKNEKKIKCCWISNFSWNAGWQFDEIAKAELNSTADIMITPLRFVLLVRHYSLIDTHSMLIWPCIAPFVTARNSFLNFPHTLSCTSLKPLIKATPHFWRRVREKASLIFRLAGQYFYRCATSASPPNCYQSHPGTWGPFFNP